MAFIEELMCAATLLACLARDIPFQIHLAVPRVKFEGLWQQPHLKVYGSNQSLIS
jgi:hypothetical protein